jgi:hypothetical protein
MTAERALLAGAMRWNGQHPAPAIPVCTPTGRRHSPHAWSRIARFKPDFCFTFKPGLSFVPAADFDRFRTFRSSITTTAWLLLSAEGRLVQKVVADMGDLAVDCVDFCLDFPPVLAELAAAAILRW